MSDKVIQQLAEEFRKFPGIGPRQAERFVYYLLRSSNSNVHTLIERIKELRAQVNQCPTCHRFFSGREHQTTGSLCPICANPKRDPRLLLLVEKDTDLETIERSRTYEGHYFVLGSLVPVLEKNPELRIRGPELLAQIASRTTHGLKEIILALSANTEGDHTADFLRQYLAPTTERHGLKISTLGRGLSTGSELEYSDPDTIKSALKHRE